MNNSLLVSLPDPTLDQNLIPCPECHAKYNIPGRRKGPTCLGFTQAQQRVVCLNCFHKGKPARTQKGANENWNSGNSENHIRALRLAAGLSQPKLAELAGVHETTISNLERGVYYGSNATRGKIARALHVTPREL
jgi:DNA-binding XRE family transcriptional regulator